MSACVCVFVNAHKPLLHLLLKGKEAHTHTPIHKHTPHAFLSPEKKKKEMKMKDTHAHTHTHTPIHKHTPQALFSPSEKKTEM